MKRFIATIWMLAAAAPALAQGAPADPEPRIRAVVELFTSQGCSACPPADRLMSELARDPGLIVLTLPVDYWDYLGWRDTFAHPSFTRRQKAYSAMRGDRKVYTPQAVINGAHHVVGSDRAQIERASVATRGMPGVLAAEIAVKRTGSAIAVTCPSSLGDGPAHLWVLPFVREREVQIGRGENGGRVMTYVNIVRGVTRIGECAAATSVIPVPEASLGDDPDGVVVLLQAGSEKKAGSIAAAARLWLR
jgi:hypothetical protein